MVICLVLQDRVLENPAVSWSLITEAFSKPTIQQMVHQVWQKTTDAIPAICVNQLQNIVICNVFTKHNIICKDLVIHNLMLQTLTQLISRANDQGVTCICKIISSKIIFEIVTNLTI